MWMYSYCIEKYVHLQGDENTFEEGDSEDNNTLIECQTDTESCLNGIIHSKCKYAAIVTMHYQTIDLQPEFLTPMVTNQITVPDCSDYTPFSSKLQSLFLLLYNPRPIVRNAHSGSHTDVHIILSLVTSRLNHIFSSSYSFICKQLDPLAPSIQQPGHACVCDHQRMKTLFDLIMCICTSRSANLCKRAIYRFSHVLQTLRYPHNYIDTQL